MLDAFQIQIKLQCVYVKRFSLVLIEPSVQVYAYNLGFLI